MTDCSGGTRRVVDVAVLECLPACTAGCRFIADRGAVWSCRTAGRGIGRQNQPAHKIRFAAMHSRVNGINGSATELLLYPGNPESRDIWRCGRCWRAGCSGLIAKNGPLVEDLPRYRECRISGNGQRIREHLAASRRDIRDRIAGGSQGSANRLIGSQNRAAHHKCKRTAVRLGQHDRLRRTSRRQGLHVTGANP